MTRYKAIYPWLSVSWLMVFAALITLLSLSRIQFSSSVFSLLPVSDQSPLVRQTTELVASDFSRRLLLVVSSADESRARATVTQLATELSALEYVSNAAWQVKVDRSQNIATELFPYRFSILSDEVRQLLLADDTDTVTKRALRRIFSLLGLAQQSLVDDPFGLYSAANIAGLKLNVEIRDELMKVSGSVLPAYLILLELRAEPFDPQVQATILNIIDSHAAGRDITIEQSGLLLHAAEGARQAGREISTIGLGSLLGITLLVIVVFRKVSPLLLMLLSMLVGYASAVAVTLLVFDEIHLVTLAFGAGLVGVSADYSLHFLCERHFNRHENALRRLLPGLSLGLLSSVLAYAAQAMAPFPGLRQMAVFSVTGLIAAWLSVVLWYPWLMRRYDAQVMSAMTLLDRFRGRSLMPDKAKITLIAIVVISALIYLFFNRGSAIDDIRLLQTSSPDLVAMERRVRQSLGVESSTQFIVVKSTSVEAALRREEALRPFLDQLKADSLLRDYQALSRVLPSQQRQSENQQLVAGLYQSQLDNLYATLNIQNRVPDARTALELDIGQSLSWPQWLQLESSQPWRNFLLSPDQNNFASVIRLAGLDDVHGRSRLVAKLEADNMLLFVDRQRDISTLLSRYRAQVANWVVLAYVAVFMVLLLRYRRQVWKVILPPASATIITLALLVQFEQGINLFHLMALILVLGIGLDMGIFMTESSGARHTWLAVSLSCMTSLLAFGLLTWSRTPVLHHFGVTVLCGLGIVWLCVFLVHSRPAEMVTK